MAKHRSKRVSRATLAATKVLAKFKPKKEDRGKFVFIGYTGKKIDPKARKAKGLFVYVNQKGKAKPVHAYYRKPLVLAKPTDYDLSKTRHKRALRDYRDENKPQITRYQDRHFMLSKKDKLRGGLDFRRLTDRIAQDIEPNHGSVYQVRVAVIVDVRGHLETYEFEQRLRGGTHRDIVFRRFYAQLAEMLKRDDLVTGGSAFHIRTLTVNRGSTREEWVDRKGELWEKADLGVAKIKSASYEIDVV